MRRRGVLGARAPAQPCTTCAALLPGCIGALLTLPRWASRALQGQPGWRVSNNSESNGPSPPQRQQRPRAAPTQRTALPANPPPLQTRSSFFLRLALPVLLACAPRHKVARLVPLRAGPMAPLSLPLLAASFARRHPQVLRSLPTLPSPLFMHSHPQSAPCFHCAPAARCWRRCLPPIYLPVVRLLFCCTEAPHKHSGPPTGRLAM